MKKVLRFLSYVLVAALSSAVTFGIFYTRNRVEAGKLGELSALIEEKFIGEVDTAAMEDAAAAAMVASLGDRWSHYMTAESYASYKDQMKNAYVGVGITVTEREDGYVDILAVSPGSPAEGAGILPGDILTHADGIDLATLTLDETTPIIKGEEGTVVRLTVKRDKITMELPVTRAYFEVTVATGEMLEGNIGLVTIENFDSRCADETIAVIDDLLEQGAGALIFDVRNNPGGYKSELVKVLDYLLPKGPLFRSEDYRGREEVDYSDESHLDMPMAVLVNLNSYSAAEFFAAALDEYDAAVIVGEKTYGKGYFQNTFRLSDGSAVNLSVGKYYTPNGNSLAGVGLTPEVEIIVDSETAAKISAGTLAPEDDPQIIAAVNALKS